VCLTDREPYVLAVLTEPDSAANNRMERVARVSAAVYAWVTAPSPNDR